MYNAHTVHNVGRSQKDRDTVGWLAAHSVVGETDLLIHDIPVLYSCIYFMYKTDIQLAKHDDIFRTWYENSVDSWFTIHYYYIPFPSLTQELWIQMS